MSEGRPVGATAWLGARHFVLVAAIAAAALVIFFPLGIAGDYPNHLARVYIESAIGRGAPLSDYYTVDWRVIPDLAMDLVVPPLARGAGVYAAGAGFVFLAMVLAPFAGFLIARRLGVPAERSMAWLGLATIFNYSLAYGFINFAISAGFALVAFSFWTKSAPSLRRSLVYAVVGAALAAAHGLGFLLFGYLVLLWELGAFVSTERKSPAGFASHMIAGVGPAFIPGLIVLGVGASGAPDLALAPLADQDYLRSRLLAVLSPFLFFDGLLARVVAFAGFVFTAVLLFLGFRRRWFSIEPRMKLVCGGLAALAFLVPDYVAGIWGLHIRFASIFLIVLAASLRANAVAPVRAAAGCFALILVLQFVAAGAAMRQVDRYADELRDILVALPDGARILPVRDAALPNRLLDHLPAYAVIEANAYAPGLFTNTSPVGVAPAWRDIHLPGNVLRMDSLDDGADRAPTPSENGYWSMTYHHGWPQRFTHVAFLRHDGAATLASPYLCEISAAPGFVLYAVKKDPAAPCAAAD